MHSQKNKNRWLIAASAIGIHISIGSIYAYSVMTNPVKNIFMVEESVIKWAFKIAILLLGFSAAFLGKWAEKVGPKISGTTAGFFYGFGILGSGFAIQIESLTLFYICYGVIGGIGLGLGYIAPVSTLIKWFPGQRGLATGLAIMGFGFAALLFGPIMANLFQSVGVSNTFYILGFIYMALILVSANYLEKPTAQYNQSKEQNLPNTIHKKDLANLSINQALKTSRFYYLWTMMFINICCGIAIIASASPMMQEKLNYSPTQAAAIVGFIGIFNGLGRIAWSTLSDFIGRIHTYMIFFVFQILAFLLLPTTGVESLFLIILFAIITMYGGGFSILPAFIGDLFGTKELGAIQGTILTAWGLAGIVGPTIYDLVKTKTGSLNTTLFIFSGMFVIALIISILMKAQITRAYKKQSLAIA